MKAFQMTHEQYKDAAQYWGKKASASMPEAELKTPAEINALFSDFKDGHGSRQTRTLP